MQGCVLFFISLEIFRRCGKLSVTGVNSAVLVRVIFTPAWCFCYVCLLTCHYVNIIWPYLFRFFMSFTWSGKCRIRLTGLYSISLMLSRHTRTLQPQLLMACMYKRHGSVEFSSFLFYLYRAFNSRHRHKAALEKSWQHEECHDIIGTSLIECRVAILILFDNIIHQNARSIYITLSCTSCKSSKLHWFDHLCCTNPYHLPYHLQCQTRLPHWKALVIAPNWGATNQSWPLKLVI